MSLEIARLSRNDADFTNEDGVKNNPIGVIVGVLHGFRSKL